MEYSLLASGVSENNTVNLLAICCVATPPMHEEMIEKELPLKLNRYTQIDMPMIIRSIKNLMNVEDVLLKSTRKTMIIEAIISAGNLKKKWFLFSKVFKKRNSAMRISR